jgi:hypothetical protein
MLHSWMARPALSPRSSGRLVLIAAMVATPVAALGQGTAARPTVHRYLLRTYQEDWRALQGADRTDVWDPVKFVPLSADGTTSLSLGSDACTRCARDRTFHQLRRRPSDRARRSLAARRLGSAADGHHGVPGFDGCA